MSIGHLQQTVFRMQHDPVFARHVLGGDSAALRSTRLADAELAMLRAVAPAVFAADRDSKRLLQFLRNASSEFRASVALGPAGDGDDDWVAGFARSDEFHACVVEDGRFPLAFFDYAARVAMRAPTAAFGALVALEGAMVAARRGVVARPAPGPGEAVLASVARLVETPTGTHALAGALQSEKGRAGGHVGEGRETVLIVAAVAAPPPGGLRELRVEVLTPRVADFLREVEAPGPVDAWPGFAARFGLLAATVETVARDFVSEGVLLLGPERSSREP